MADISAQFAGSNPVSVSMSSRTRLIGTLSSRNPATEARSISCSSVKAKSIGPGSSDGGSGIVACL